MAFRCPYCEFRITVKTAPKPGKYTPKCPKCGGKISLTVPVEIETEWHTAKIAGETPNIPAPEEATMAVPVPAAVKKAAPVRAKVQADPDATIAPSSDSRQSASAEDTESTQAPATPPQGSDNTEVTGALHVKPRADSENTEVTGAYLDKHPARVDPNATYATDGEASPSEDDRTGVFEPPTQGTSNEQTLAPPPAKPKKKAAKAAAEEEREMPDILGGYEVQKELGRGGMGAVYLARQVSLDRPVALKVMNAKWASDPVFLARFTREAYAAAQLVHHNVVQIYDIGEQQGINFFSMEFVEGKSLGEVIKKDGRMSQEAAISHIIQAARGLKFAHDRGMIHRDVKPDNLMLNVHGVVKVADLGLVKTAAMTASDDQLPKTERDMAASRKSMTGLSSLPSDITAVNTAMGSPSYMSPEQCRDASHVDPRADIYSLGCTLYALLSGKPPFQGTTIFELMAKHATEPATPLAAFPPEVNEVLLKSLAKSAEERQQTMDEFIAGLERCLPGKGGPFKPTAEHVTTLEECVQKFNNVSAAKIRRKIIPAFFIGGLLATVIGAFAGGAIVSLAVLALMVETVLAYFVVDGVMRKTLVFRKTREWVFGARFTDWAMAIFGGLIGVLALFLLGLHWVFLGTAVVAVGLAFVMHFLFDRGLAGQRQPVIEEAEKMLKRFRVAGLEEDQLRLFVAQNAGRDWEEFYETLFGFEAKLAIRPKVQEISGDVKLPQHASWREPLLARIDKARQARQEAKTKKLLTKLESKKLQAEGVSKKEAEEQAEAAAEQIVEQVAVIKEAKPTGKPVNVRKMMETAVKAPKKLPKKPGEKLKKIAKFVTGWQFRFVLSAVLIASGALWAKQFEKALTAIAKDTQTVTGSENSKVATEAAKKAIGSFEVLLGRAPLPDFKILGIDLSGILDSLNPLVAGLILLSSIFYHQRISVGLCVLGALVAAVPHLVIGLSDEASKEVLKASAEGGLSFQLHQITMLLGLILGGLAFVLSFRRQ
ncbi:bifunctional serine/threonine protein kinase/MFS transporter [Zavarzinella formosa]|uniref:bifunctional serine/threonine protein kinase/MFS transporter n=1 Tax=Zavarzinella formosa TaxID=360055 RepID=UPI0002D79CA4|nr:bifunctional serine/threonine protein kinase/MFS transporter [Zavarzinella formosa]